MIPIANIYQVLTTYWVFHKHQVIYYPSVLMKLLLFTGAEAK